MDDREQEVCAINLVKFKALEIIALKLFKKSIPSCNAKYDHLEWAEQKNKGSGDSNEWESRVWVLL